MWRQAAARAVRGAASPSTENTASVTAMAGPVWALRAARVAAGARWATTVVRARARRQPSMREAWLSASATMRVSGLVSAVTAARFAV